MMKSGLNFLLLVICCCALVKGAPRDEAGSHQKRGCGYCDYWNGIPCGGNGECVCGTCMCNHDYTGDACECSLATDNCVDSNGGLCNNHGNCECGMCRCERDSWYRGPTCEEHPFAVGGCGKNRACVECRLFRSDDDVCQADCQHVTLTDSLTGYEGSEWRQCRYSTSVPPYTRYDFYYHGNQVVAIKDQ